MSPHRPWTAQLSRGSLAPAQVEPPPERSRARAVDPFIDLGWVGHAPRLGTTETGELLSASAIRRLCCDAEVIPAVLGTDSAVLDVGRTRRLVTPAIWKALVARDRHCRFPHCTRPPMMSHAHHVEHWADGGVTSLDNLVLLCGHHHRAVHQGPWEIRRAGPTDYTVVRPETAGASPPDSS